MVIMRKNRNLRLGIMLQNGSKLRESGASELTVLSFPTLIPISWLTCSLSALFCSSRSTELYSSSRLFSRLLYSFTSSAVVWTSFSCLLCSSSTILCTWCTALKPSASCEKVERYHQWSASLLRLLHFCLLVEIKIEDITPQVESKMDEYWIEILYINIKSSKLKEIGQ